MLKQRKIFYGTAIVLCLMVASSAYPWYYKSGWEEVHSADGSVLFGVYAYDENRAWAVGEDGVFLYTTDGGSNWTEVTLKSGDYHLRGVHFTSTNTGETPAGMGEHGRTWAGTCGHRGSIRLQNQVLIEMNYFQPKLFL